MRRKTVTIRDIAVRAGLSPASISMILNRRSPDRFNRETVEKVFRLASEMGYVSRSGKTFSPYRPQGRLIYIICPSLANPFYTSIIQGVETAALKKDFITAVRTTYWNADNEELIMEQASKANVAGVIFAMIPQQPELAYNLSRTLPVVAVGDKRGDLNFSTVDMNNFAAGQIMANHLLGLGHKNIAFLSTALSEQHTARLRRWQGLKETVEAAKGHCLLFTKDAPAKGKSPEYNTGYELADTCLAKEPQVTAFVCVNDMVAYGAYDALLARGLQIPKDKSIAGFDNIFPSRLSGLSLTTIDNYLPECGKSAFSLLRKEIKAFEQQGSFDAITHLEYKCRLITRRSTAQAPKTGKK